MIFFPGCQIEIGQSRNLWCHRPPRSSQTKSPRSQNHFQLDRYGKQTSRWDNYTYAHCRIQSVAAWYISSVNSQAKHINNSDPRTPKALPCRQQEYRNCLKPIHGKKGRQRREIQAAWNIYLPWSNISPRGPAIPVLLACFLGKSHDLHSTLIRRRRTRRLRPNFGTQKVQQPI